MRKLFLVIGLVAMCGCQLFPVYTAVPAYYPKITKPVLRKAIVTPGEDMPAAQKAAIWEENAHVLFEYVEQLDAAVDEYNKFAAEHNKAVDLIKKGKP